VARTTVNSADPEKKKKQCNEFNTSFYPVYVLVKNFKGTPTFELV